MNSIRSTTSSALRPGDAYHRRPRKRLALEDTEDEQDGLELPVNPDEGAAIPDEEERVISVPS